MAGHSHWAGIKHKKGRADKQDQRFFLNYQEKLLLQQNLAIKTPEMNARLRAAIQAARSANMPKDNIERALDKSSISADSNFEQY